MESIIRNVKDIASNERQWLESALKQHLEDNQRVLIMVLSPGVQADEAVREKAMADLKDISRKGAANREAQGVSVEEADRILDEAIEHARKRSSS
jgi:hypothetical protein